MGTAQNRIVSLAIIMRRTRQCEVIKTIVSWTDSHPTAEDVHEPARRQLPGISLDTVYRNLKWLIANGEIRVLEGAGGANRYDACTRNHYHFVCECCGWVIDLNLSLREKLERLVAEDTGFLVHGHKLEFRGICDRCRVQK